MAIRQIEGEALAPSAWRALLAGPHAAFDRYLEREVYARGGAAYLAAQKKRFAETLECHARAFGDAPCALMRAPGRLNAFLEYLDMCAGDHMSTTIDGDIPMTCSPRDDDTVVIRNTADLFPERRFSVRAALAHFKSAPWGSGASAGLADSWDNRTRVHPYHGGTKGDHLNYCLAAFLRLAWEAPDRVSRGANITFGPSTIPLRAGTSSSSAIVVLSTLACLRSNPALAAELSIPALCRLLGEAEWYVGTHGGANDQTTIVRNEVNGILYNRHSRAELDSTSLPFLHGLRIVMANSLWEANKALGANYVFNLRKGWMDLGNDLLTRVIDCCVAHAGPRGRGWALAAVRARFGWQVDAAALPALDAVDWRVVKAKYRLFGSLDAGLLGLPQATIAELIQLLPAEIDPVVAGKALGKDRTALARDYTLPDDTDRVWRPRNAAVFFNTENVIGRQIEALLLEADAALRRGAAPASAAYDAYRLKLGALIECAQATIRDDFMVSNDQLELVLRVARDGPGYVGGKLTGAGSGGCVCVFVLESEAEAMLAHLDRAYYGVPAHFEHYRGTLRTLADAAVRREMEGNLDRALADIPAQRRVVAFSRGAGVVAPR
jgi:galactokinase